MTIGIDYGTSVIRVARRPDSQSSPELVYLAGDKPFLPIAAMVKADSPTVVFGVDAYRQRRTALRNSVQGFRDRLASASSSLQLTNRAFSAAELQADFFSAVRQIVSSLIGAADDEVVLTIPDDWCADRWSLPIALTQAKWEAACLIREWAAVMSVIDEPSATHAVFVSLGVGPARATLCQRDGNTWSRTATLRCDSVSGALLRKRLLDGVSHDIIEQLRVDPQLDAAVDQALHDAIDDVIDTLVFGGDGGKSDRASLQMQMRQKTFQRWVSRDELAQLAHSMRAPLEEMVERLIDESPTPTRSVPIYVWGELTHLIPVTSWLARFCPAGMNVHELSLDAVAAGAATTATEGAASARVCTDCGAYHQQSGTGCPDCGARAIMIVDTYVSAKSRYQRPPARLTLVSKEGGHPIKEIQHDRFRLGRHPLSEWAFDQNQYPSVSMAHAVITWEEDHFLLSDLDTPNGTWLNGERIKQCELQSGDEIRLSHSGPTLRFTLEHQA